MCSLFDPFSARAGLCGVDGEEKLAYKACVNREDFELHPKGRRRNLRGEVNVKAKGDDKAEGAKDGKVKSRGNEKSKADKPEVPGKRKGTGPDKIQKEKGDTSDKASKKASKSSGKGDKKDEKSKSDKSLMEKMGFKKTKKRSKE